MRRIRKSTIFCTVVALAALAFSQASYAIITNGGFELALTGWSAIGNASIVNAGYGTGPTQGASQALLSTKRHINTFNDAALESFLGLASGSLDGLGFGNARSGTALKQSFFANAGDVLSFDWNFLTNEGSHNDFAFVTIGGLNGLADTQPPSVLSATPFAKEKGFHTFSIVLATTGMYTLGLGVVNVHNKKVHSGLLIDNVALNSPYALNALNAHAPEPSTMALLGLGLAGLAAVKRKYKR